MHFGKYSFIPVAGLKYSHLDIDNYTETAAGGASLVVKPKDIDQWTVSAGVKLTGKKSFVEATYVPELRFIIGYDMKPTQQQTLSNFTGGGASFVTEGAKPAQVSYNVGIGLNAYTRDNILFTMNYDLEMREFYVSHSAFFKLQYHWT